MIRNLKVLGLAACAVLALSAFAASAAQAASFTKPAETTRLTVTPDGTGTTSHHVFDAAGASITCPTVHGEALLAGEATTAADITTSFIEYTGTTLNPPSCKFVGQDATVKMNGCGYTFFPAAPGTPGANATVHVFCPGGNLIEFSVPSPACKVTVPGGQALSGITYHNINSETEVTVEAHVTGINYTATGAGCPTAGTQSNGNYTTGNFIVTAENLGGVMKSIKVDP